VRYERDRPGELVHMDVKKLGRIPAGGGWRADGPVTTNHRSRGSNTGVGYDYKLQVEGPRRLRWRAR